MPTTIIDVSDRVSVRRVGDGLRHSFFGYYNKTNFCPKDRYLLAHRSAMFTGDLTGTEACEVGFFDLEDNDRWHSLGETSTWNWQMGAQLQWLGATREVIFNTRAAQLGATGADQDINRAKTSVESPINPEFRATVVNRDTAATRSLSMPVYVVAPDGSFALTLNYARFMVTHKTIGYHTLAGQPDLPFAPEDDGIWRIDLKTGVAKLILSLRQLYEHAHVPSMNRAMHWITHMEVNPSGTRFLFIHRWTERPEDEFCYLHRLYTINGDGTGLRLLEDADHPLPQLDADYDTTTHGTFDYEKSPWQISHPLWKSDHEVIVWGPHQGEIHYHLYDERSGDVAVIGPDVLTENGHMTYSHCGRWLLSDTYPDARTNERVLFIFDTETGIRYDLGNFYTPSDLGKHNRCDLHPRWSRDNRRICIDSVHEGARQMYLLDVADILAEIAASSR
jgi:hypothetical protein